MFLPGVELRSEKDRITAEEEVLPQKKKIKSLIGIMGKSYHFLRLLRPHQYIKNLFILLPAFFAIKIAQPRVLVTLLVAFIAFSFVASSIYIINDYRDLEEDRVHPKKRNRPLASGDLTKREASIFLSVILSIGMILLYNLDIRILGIALFYFLLNLLYSFRLKHVAILDVCIVSSGFVIRLFIGARAANVDLSMWIVLMTFLLALFISLAKRRDDMLIFQETGNRTRKIIDGYSLEFLNLSMIMMASIVIVSYLMYCVTMQEMHKSGAEYLYLTVIFVILGVLRYLQITFVNNDSGSPTQVLIKDRFLQMCILGWVAAYLYILYL